jgi:protein TonB
MKKLIVMLVAFVGLLGTIEVQAQIEAPTKSIAAAQYYEGGQDAMYQFIKENVRYPLMAKNNRIQGECIIHLQIQPNGSVLNLSIVTNVGGGCGAEALRVVKLLKFTAPGFKVDANIPVKFKL